MFCPNFTNKEVFDGFNQLIESFGGKPMTEDEFRSSELRNQRTGLDFSAMEAAYKVYHLNGGNFLNLTPTGQPSLLFNNILDIVGDQTKAIAIKALFYTDSFRNKYGDWINNKENNNSFDVNGEPLLSTFLNKKKDSLSNIEKESLYTDKQAIANSKEQEIEKQYGFNVKFKPVSSIETFGESILNRLESGKTVSSSEIVSLFVSKKYFSESNSLLSEIVVRHDIPVRFEALNGRIMTTKTDKDGGSYIAIDLSNLQDVSNNFLADKLLHEVVHAITVGVINNPNNIEQRALVSLNRSLFDTFSKAYPKDKYSRSTFMYYGLTNEKEFIAEFVSNEDFRAAIYKKAAELDKKGKKIIKQIKSFINRISRLLVNKNIFQGIQQDLLKLYENNIKKFLLNIPTIQKGNIKQTEILNILYKNIDTETVFNDDAAQAQEQLIRNIETWEENNFLELPITANSKVGQPLTELQVREVANNLSEKIATALSKRLAAIMASNISTSEKLKYLQQLLPQISLFRENVKNLYNNLITFIQPLSALLLHDSIKISKIRQNQQTIDDTEYMYQNHANFGVYVNILQQLLDLLSQPSTLSILQDEIENNPLNTSVDVAEDINRLKNLIDKSLSTANSALIKTKKILIINLKQKFADKAESLHMIDLIDYIDELEEIDYDSNVFFNWVGSIDSAKDPGLRVLHNLVYNAILKSDRETNEKATTLLLLLQQLKFGESVKDLYELDENGLTTGYLLRKYNYGQMYKDYDDFLKHLNDSLGLELDNRVAPIDDELRKEWNNARNKWLSEHVERKYKPEYYEAFSKLSYETQKARSLVLSEILAIKQKCLGEDGNYHYEELTDDEWDTLLSLYTTKRWLSSEYNIDGTPKTGIALKIAKELQLLNEDLYSNKNEILRNYKKWLTDRNAIIEQCGGLDKMKDPESDFDWESLRKWDERNTRFTLRINKDTGRSYLFEQIEDELDEIPVYEVDGDGGTLYEELNRLYKELINTARNTNTGEINPKNLSEGAKKKALELLRQMSKLRGKAKRQNTSLRKILKLRRLLIKKYTDTIRTDVYIKMYNEAKKRDLTQPGYLRQFKLMTGKYEFDDLTQTEIYKPHLWYTKIVAKPEYQEQFMEMIPGDGYINSDDDQSGYLNPEFDESEGCAWIPSKHIPKYLNTDRWNKIQNSPTLKNLYDEVQKTLLQANEKMPNLRYHDNYLLPQINGSFFKRLSGAKNSKNISKWRKIWNYIKYGANILGEEYFGISSEDDTDYGQSILNIMLNLDVDEIGAVLTNLSQAVINKVSGEMPDGRLLNIIPQYYTRKLKDPSLISSDLIGILCEYYNNACKFEEKSKIKDECESIIDMMLDRRYNTKRRLLTPVYKTEDGKVSFRNIITKLPKEGKRSNTYSAARKFLDMNLYNIRSGSAKFGKWNASKFGSTFRALTVALNLGVSPVVAAVGYFTSMCAHVSNAISGQKYDAGAAFNASNYVLWHCIKNIGSIGQGAILGAATATLSPLGLGLLTGVGIGAGIGALAKFTGLGKRSDIANPVSKDPLMVFAEYYNLSGIGKRKYQHSNRNRYVNMINDNWCFGFLTAFDYIAKSNVMITTLMSYRYYNGEFITKEDIIRNGWNKPNAEVKTQIKEWNKCDTLFSYLNVEDGKFHCDESVLDAYKKIEHIIHARIDKTAEAVDGMATETQKAAITTSFLGASVLMHRQYFPLMLQERYGHTVFDPDQQQYIHGEFRTLANIIKLFLIDGWRLMSFNNASTGSVLTGSAVGLAIGSVFGPIGTVIGSTTGGIVGALKGKTYNNIFNNKQATVDEYVNTADLYDQTIDQSDSEELRYALENEKNKTLSKIYQEAQLAITKNYQRRKLLAEFMMYKLVIVPLVGVLASIAASAFNGKDPDDLLMQMIAYIGHRVQWEQFTPYRLDDALNNFKSTSPATGTLDKFQDFTSSILNIMFPRSSLFDTFSDKSKNKHKNSSDNIKRGVYSEHPIFPFSYIFGDENFNKVERDIFKLTPLHNLYEQWYDSKSKDRYFTNQIMKLED